MTKVTNLIIEYVEGEPQIGAKGQVCIGYRDADGNLYSIILGADVIRALIKAHRRMMNE